MYVLYKKYVSVQINQLLVRSGFCSRYQSLSTKAAGFSDVDE